MSRKIFILLLFIFSASTVIILSGCAGDIITVERAIERFTRKIERGEIGEITLIIYSPQHPLSFEPRSVETFIDEFHSYKKIIEGNQLLDYIDLFKQLRNVELIPVREKSQINVIFYYVFEDINRRRIFDFALWGTGDSHSMFINGIEFEHNPIFTEIILPFLA